MTDYFTSLNDKQREGVQTIQGPVLILAGAGSGKTKALTTRIAYMLEQGISPQEILAITFTNKAAKEMKERVKKLVGASADHMWISTFHSFGARFLRREIDVIPPYTRQFTIYDAQDSQQVVKGILKEMNLDDKQFAPNALQARISNAKNNLQNARAAQEAADDFFAEKAAEVYARYEAILQANNALDFDDLLLLPAVILQRHADVRKAYQNRFRYILIDEYQDTNHAQYVLTQMLVGPEQNLCVVGDVDQSIYSWRGADVQNIIDFQRDYPRAKVLKLEQNYRSTQTILNAANHVIENNEHRPSKNLWTDQADGEPIYYYEAVSETDEAQFCAGEMQRLVSETPAKYGDMAVLYRTNAQSRAMEEALVRRGIAYTIIGGTRFYDRQEIKDVLAYLKVLQNPRDDVSVERIINVPKRGIGTTTVSRVKDAARLQGVSLFEMIMAADGIESLNAGTRKKLNAFSVLMLELMNTATTENVTDLLEAVLAHTELITSLLNDTDPRAQSRVENIGELVSVAKTYEDETEEPTLQGFLEQVALVNDVDTFEESSEKVTLMTLHSAKGLEFPIVFLIGMDEGLFPHARTLFAPDELEEERRLCYVGITRAEKILYLTHASSRTVFGSTNPYLVSRFVGEIPEDLVEKKENKNRIRWGQADRAKRTGQRVVSNASVGVTVPKGKVNARYDWRVGDRARHTKWGLGTVVEVRGEGERMQLKLEFPGRQVRLVMVKFAPLTKE
ncbi:MAG: DNA helicase PcrA [Negativicoccus succinicivorans]|uniref:DNA helicase PcrA n=1 Tax=Negativicoccus succinicivorans TaxID=620903 RepID=UPI0023538C6D|nr:DNA helicase PcrA [Negativicoccus succinicivorans]MBS5890157.1 DNA helicase PcrA [Negativicoccus succinicivorans]MDU1066037.1 DNA helicase PcrA [Negativicoccus succinicivorans]